MQFEFKEGSKPTMKEIKKSLDEWKEWYSVEMKKIELMEKSIGEALVMLNC